MKFVWPVVGIFVALKLVDPVLNQSTLTATITPQGDFVAALDESFVEFTCAVTNTGTIQWFVDNITAGSTSIKNRGVTTTQEAESPPDSGVFVSILSIPATQQNNGTTLRCIAVDLGPGPSVNSEFMFFQVQGLLDAPPNTVVSEVNDQFVRILSWDAPFTLNITNVDPDILYYQICYNITMDDLVCLNVSSRDQREFRFLNVRDSLAFTVTAFNVLGQGNASETVHEPSRCDNLRGVVNITVGSLISFTPSGPSPEVTLLINQTNSVGPRETCFCIYQVQTVLLGSSAAATDHGPQIPKLSQINSDNLQLSLTVEGLTRDEVYVANITTQNDNGEEIVVGTAKFNTYDVQSVSGRALSGGIQLSCTFAEGSQAQSCILTICRIESTVEVSCMNTTISREDRQSGIQLLGLQRGLYVLRKVVEVESDGQLTVHRKIDALEFTIEQAPTRVSTDIAESPSVGGVSGPSSSDIGAIVGGVLGGICIIIIVVIVIIVTVLLLKNTKKTEKKNPIANLLSESEIDGTKRYSDSQIVEPTYDSLVPLSSREEIPASGHPHNHTHDTETSDKDLWSQDVNSKDSPTFPLYSDVMGKGYPPSVGEVDGGPEVPQMQLTVDDLKELNVSTDTVVPTDGQQNPNTEEIQKADLSAESGRETTSEPTASQQRADDELQIVIETLLSLNPEKAQPSAESEDQDQKGPIYAELDHKKKEQSKNYVPDMTGVHYSEIKTDEIAPRLPQKKSKLAAKDLSTSDSLPKSAAHSAPNSDTYDV